MQSTKLTKQLGIELPLIQAPMAGGYTTPVLVASVSNTGGLGSLAGALLKPEEIVAEAAAIRALTRAPFAINLFVPEPMPTVSDAEIKAAAEALAPIANELGVEPPRPVRAPAPDFNAQLEAVLEARPAVVSFVMGVPPSEAVNRLLSAGIKLIGTATNEAEAQALATAGVEILVAQGSEAGGHRATFLPAPADRMIGAFPLVQQLAGAFGLPIIAAGGIMNGRGVTAALAAGADAVQMGTVFMLAREAGTPAELCTALIEMRNAPSVISRVFTGKPARVIRNRFVEMMEQPGIPILPWPYQGPLTVTLRRAALKQGRREFMFLLAGQGAPFVQAMPAGSLIREFLGDYRIAVKQLSL